MALPASRNTTYAAGSQVKSADLNDLQDQIIALYQDDVVNLGMVGAYPDGANISMTTNISGRADWFFSNSAGSAEILAIPIQITAGRIIRSIRFYYREAATEQLKFELAYTDATIGTGNSVASVNSTTGSSDTSTLLSASDHTVVAGRSYYALVRKLNGISESLILSAAEMTVGYL